MEVLIYKAVAALILAVFFYYGYDMKKRANWKNLAPQRSTLLMKTMACLLCVILYTSLISINTVESSDLVALLLFTLGAVFVRLAKKELEKNNAFTWTGYVLEKPNLVTSGIYSYIRHPLYTGVYLVEFGGVLIVLPRTPMWFPETHLLVGAVMVLGLLYAMIFNSLLAKKESANLNNIFGDSYKKYSEKVHAFIPFIQQ